MVFAVENEGEHELFCYLGEDTNDEMISANLYLECATHDEGSIYVLPVPYNVYLTLF